MLKYVQEVIGGLTMDNNDKIQIFEDKKIRTAWNEEKEEWYFSVVDVIGVLTDSPNPNNYWKVLKKRLKDEGNESVTNCNQLKLKSPKDGKKYKEFDITVKESIKKANIWDMYKKNFKYLVSGNI